MRRHEEGAVALEGKLENVTVFLRMEQDLGADGTESLECITDGTYYCRHGIYYIQYREAEETGLAQVDTLVKVAPDCVTVLRAGERRMRLTLREGERRQGAYETGYGALQIGASETKIRAALGERGGTLELEYILELNGARCARNRLRLEVRPKDRV